MPSRSLFCKMLTNVLVVLKKPIQIANRSNREERKLERVLPCTDFLLKLFVSFHVGMLPHNLYSTNYTLSIHPSASEEFTREDFLFAVPHYILVRHVQDPSHQSVARNSPMLMNSHFRKKSHWEKWPSCFKLTILTKMSPI